MATQRFILTFESDQTINANSIKKALTTGRYKIGATHCQVGDVDDITDKLMNFTQALKTQIDADIDNALFEHKFSTDHDE